MSAPNLPTFNLKSNHEQALKETEKFKKKPPTIKDYNIRMTKIQNWLKIEYTDHYNLICKPLTEEQKKDKLKYYKATHEFEYPLLEAKVITSYISSNQVKCVKKGVVIYKSYVDLRKYSDAIKWGADRAKQVLSPEYCAGMASYLDTLRKENTEKKGDGQLDEKEADPISFPFMRSICNHAIKLGWITLWTWTVLQWHCMSRSVNIGKLTFSSFKVGIDSIIVTFNSTKTDQTGDKVSPKNCYANPFNFHLCVATALGCYFALNDEHFSKGRQTIFKTEKSKKQDSAAHGYCGNLLKLFNKMGDSIYTWVRPGHANGHGIRKGAAIAVTSATTCPPPTSSVARRGEWSLGKVFDIYWQWAESGDQYCGRILAGLDPMSHEFEALPPHFVVDIKDPDVELAMTMNFKNIYKNAKSDKSSNVIAILLRCLASLVHHSDALLEVIAKNPGHPFMNIAIINNSPALLQCLKTKIVTTTSETIPFPTGVPPHIKQLSMVHELFEFLKEEREERKKLEEKLKKIVEDAIENFAISNGHLTLSSLQNLLKSHQESVAKDFHQKSVLLEKKIDGMMTLMKSRTNNYASPSDPNFVTQDAPTFANGVSEDEIQRMRYCYNGRFWDVPINFDFPKDSNLRQGFQFWIQGLPNFKDASGDAAPVMPFKHLKCDKGLPKKLHNKLRGQWKPIMKVLMEAPNLPPVHNANHLTHEQMDEAYSIASAHLQAKVSYIFLKEEFNGYHKWRVSNWSKHVRYGMIVDHGTESDIANLPPPTKLNQTRKRKNNEIAEA